MCAFTHGSLRRLLIRDEHVRIGNARHVANEVENNNQLTVQRRHDEHEGRGGGPAFSPVESPFP